VEKKYQNEDFFRSLFSHCGTSRPRNQAQTEVP
jgi:hypothetical protein